MPEEWQTVPIGDVLVSAQYGLNLPVKPNGTVPIIGMKDMVAGRVENSGWGCVELPARDHARYLLQEGDILLNRTNSPDLVGKVALWTRSEEAVFPSYIVRFRTNKERVDAAFINYVLNSDDGQTRLKALSTRGVSQANINPTTFRKAFTLHLPPAAEQRRIATVLDAWNDAIGLAEHVVTLCNARERALRERSYADTGGVPTSLEAIFKAAGKVNANAIDHVITVGKYAIRPQSEHFGKSVASKNLSNYNVIEPGQFVYDPMSLYYGAIGRYDDDQTGVVSPVYRVLSLQDGVISDFVVSLLKTERLRYEFDAQSSQGNNEGKRRGIDREVFFQIPVRLPSEEVQLNVAAVNSAIAMATRAAKSRVDLLRRQKRGLMQKLLTGEWRVPATGDAFVPGGPVADRLEAAE